MAIKPVPTAEFRRIIVQLAEQEKPKVAVEIGIYSGGLSKLLADVHSIKRLVLVDPWHGSFKSFGQEHMDNIFHEVREWAATRQNVELLRMTSLEASKTFLDESVDFVEIDGSHRYEMVKLDIESWLPKLKSGCIICGDNYEYHGVYEAVDELLPQRETLGKGRVWWARK